MGKLLGYATTLACLNGDNGDNEEIVEIVEIVEICATVRGCMVMQCVYMHIYIHIHIYYEAYIYNEQT